MSGPGGPATSAVTMTPPSAVGAARAMGQIKANIGSMIDQGATETEVNDYLSHEGVTVDQLKNSPAAAPYQKDSTAVSAYKPTTTQRMGDLLRARQTGTKAPALPDNAPAFQSAMDWLDTMGRGVDVAAHGVTGGLSDEAAGLGGGLAAMLPGSANPGTFSAGFKKGADATNATIDKFHAENPVTGGLLETGGLLASPLFRVGADWQQAGPTMFSRAARAAGVGAGAGAMTGAAYDRGDAGSRLEAALYGGAIGAPLAGVAVPALETATGAGQTFMGALNARRAAGTDPAARARAMVAAAINRDQFSPIPQQGEALASAGGPNVQALARQATVAPGNARAVAANYFQGAAADAPEAIGRATRQNISGRSYLPSIDDFTNQQQTAAAPLYTEAYGANQSMASPELDKILATPEGKKALRKAATMMLNDRSRIGIPDKELTETVRDLVSAGKMNAPTTGAGIAAGLKLRGLDYVKRALDSEYEGLAAAGKKTEAGIILGLKKDLVKELDNLDVTAAAGPNSVKPEGGAYARARAAFAGPAQLKKAADWGSTVLTSGDFTDQKIQFFQNLSPSEQDAARIGLARSVMQTAGKMGSNTDPVVLFLKGKNANDLMRTMLPNQDAFDSFVGTLQQQSRIVKSARTVMGGSPTASRIAEGADAAAQEQALTNQLTMARDAWNLATGRGGGRVSAIVNLTNRARNAATGVSEPTANELGRLLFNPDQTLNLDTVRSLSQSLVPQQQLQATQQALLRRLIGGQGTLPAAPVGAFIGSH